MNCMEEATLNQSVLIDHADAIRHHPRLTFPKFSTDEENIVRYYLAQRKAFSVVLPD